MLSVLTTNSPWFIGSASLSTQQQAQSFGLPLWLWLVVAVFIILIAIIWTLHEEGELGKKKAEKETPAATSTRTTDVVSAPNIAVTTEVDAASPAAGEAESITVPDTYAESAVAAESITQPETDSGPQVAGVAEETEAVTAPEVDVVEAAPPVRPDNLKRVKGIGPKIEQLLKASGIITFAQLADTAVSRIQAILDEADYTLAEPESWPEQARQFAEAKK